MSKRPKLLEDFQGKVFKDRVREEGCVCVISSWTFFWLVVGEVIRSQHHQPSSSNWPEVYMLLGSIKLTSFTCWGFQCLHNSSKDMAQNIIYSPWGGTKSHWLCLMANLLLFCFAWLFLSFFIFSLLWLNLLFGTWGRPRRLKFFYRQEVGGGDWGESVREGPIVSYLVTIGLLCG